MNSKIKILFSILLLGVFVALPLNSLQAQAKGTFKDSNGNTGTTVTKDITPPPGTGKETTKEVTGGPDKGTTVNIKSYDKGEAVKEHTDIITITDKDGNIYTVQKDNTFKEPDYPGGRVTYKGKDGTEYKDKKGKPNKDAHDKFKKVNENGLVDKEMLNAGITVAMAEGAPDSSMGYVTVNQMNVTVPAGTVAKFDLRADVGSDQTLSQIQLTRSDPGTGGDGGFVLNGSTLFGNVTNSSQVSNGRDPAVGLPGGTTFSFAGVAVFPATAADIRNGSFAGDPNQIQVGLDQGTVPGQRTA